ncbi:hypothetical protein AEM42_04195 [Betaproteobacteria bacterium UKL13-2]|nr:hypothetical protein AEM42_04195 [Betaproteobacteria bacterium UKL13-2]
MLYTFSSTPEAVGAAGVYSKATTSTYLNNAADWILGRLQTAEVTSAVPYTTLNSNPTRRSSYTYNATTGLLTNETVEPQAGAGSSAYLSTTYTYDIFGNRESANVVGLGVNRTSISRYCSAATAASHAGCTRNGRFPTSLENALGHQEVRTYDTRFGAVIGVTDANGLSASSLIDRMGRKFCETRADGAQTSTRWLSGGDGASSGGNAYYAVTTDSSGASGQQHFDLLNREVAVKSTTFAGGLATATTSFDGRGRKATVTRPVGAATGTTTFSYDDLNRVIAETGPGTASASMTYAGLVSTVTRASSAGNQTTTTHSNVRGEVVRVIDPRNGELRLQYDHHGNLERKSTQVGLDGTATGVGSNISDTTITYNVRGQKLTLTDPDTGTTTYSYNGAGELLSQTDAAYRSTSMTYDVLGRMRTRVDPNYNTTWLYDSTDGTANGSHCSNTAAGINNGKSRGRLCAVTSNDGNTSHTYDALARLSTSTQSVALTGRSYTQAVSYDGLSRVKRIVYPVTGLTLQNNYNSVGYLQTITEPANGSKVHWQALGRFDDGQISQMQYGINASTGGVFTSTRSYDSQGRISGISTIPTAGAGGGSTAIQNASFTFDAIGNLTSRSDSAAGVSLAPENFTYDLLNRLTSVSGGAGANKTHTYDSFGNLTTRTDTGSYTYQAGTHRLQNVTGGIATGNTVQSYTYNGAGDITQISGGNINGGGTRTITPSAFSVPLAISQPSSNHTNGTLSIQYGYTGDRVRLTERRPNRPTATPSNQHVNLTTYLLAGATALFEEDRLGAGNSSEPFRYRYKHSINTPEGTVSIVVIDAPWGGSGSSSMRSDRTFHRDHLGSTVAITDENGTEFLGYDAWGKRRNANGQDNNIAAWVGLSSKTDRGYTGHEHIDDIGLIHMNGRLYDPITGRMMSADPIIQAPYLLQNYNRYSYVMNNPLSLTDPSGFSWWTRWRKPILAIAAAAIIGPWVGNQVMWALAPTSANAAMIGAIAGGAAGGFAAGGILGGNIQSALTGALTGAISGGVAGHFGNNYSLARVGAETLAGGVTSAIRGGSFRDGMRSALVFSLVTYGAVKAREFELAHSERTPGQVGESPGFRGIEGKGAGGRLNRDSWQQNSDELGAFDPTRADWSEAVAKYHSIVRPSALGCHQGGPGCMFGVPYAPNSFRDNVAEAFAGVHDFLNHVPFYNADGTARNFLPQFGRVGYWAGEVISAANVLVAAPIVAVSAVPDELRWIFSERRRR